MPCIAYLLVLIGAALAARLPVGRLMLSALGVLPFAACFALVSAISSQVERAAMLLIRGYLSGFAALLLIATTSLPAILSGFKWLRAPSFLLQVMQFLYRYLVVLLGEAESMRDAGRSRGGRIRTLELKRAAGSAAVLFAKSYARAQAIHNAMTARGFDGRMPRAFQTRFARADVSFLALCWGAVLAPRIFL